MAELALRAKLAGALGLEVAAQRRGVAVAVAVGDQARDVGLDAVVQAGGRRRLTRAGTGVAALRRHVRERARRARDLAALGGDGLAVNLALQVHDGLVEGQLVLQDVVGVPLLDAEQQLGAVEERDERGDLDRRGGAELEDAVGGAVGVGLEQLGEKLRERLRGRAHHGRPQVQSLKLTLKLAVGGAGGAELVVQVRALEVAGRVADERQLRLLGERPEQERGEGGLRGLLRVGAEQRGHREATVAGVGGEHHQLDPQFPHGPRTVETFHGPFAGQAGPAVAVRVLGLGVAGDHPADAQQENRATRDAQC